MAASKKVVAVRDFVAITTEDGYRVVHKGEHLDASDEIVVANPSLFEEPVEQATAAPGEKRKR